MAIIRSGGERHRMIERARKLLPKRDIKYVAAGTGGVGGSNNISGGSAVMRGGGGGFGR